MAIHLDWASILAIAILVVAVAGVAFARQHNPKRRLRMDFSIETRAQEPDPSPAGVLVIRISNVTPQPITISEVGLTCSNRQPYQGQAWCAKNEGLWIQLDPQAPPYEVCLRYTELLGELRALGVSLRDAWAVDSLDTVYAYRIPKDIIQRMTMDLQRANEPPET